LPGAACAELTSISLFDDEAAYRRAVRSPALEPGAMARLYGREEGTVEVLPDAAALAIKIAMDRLVVSGDVGDRDVYGAQQHDPLLGLVSAIGKLLDRRERLRRGLMTLGASGQLGHGIPEKSPSGRGRVRPRLHRRQYGVNRPGPYYLGSGELATAPATTRADLTRLLRAARKLDIPLLAYGEDHRMRLAVLRSRRP
jgi:Domain of unknown function (DUF4387)